MNELTRNHIPEPSQTTPWQPPHQTRPFPKKQTMKLSNQNIEDGLSKESLNSSNESTAVYKPEAVGVLEVNVDVQKAKIFEDFNKHILNKYPECYPGIEKYNHITIHEYFETGTPCHFAALNSDDILLHKLILLGANIHQKDVYSETPLIAACRVSKNLDDTFLPKKNCINFLVEGGSDLLLKDQSGKRPLEYLYEIDYFNTDKVIEFLKNLTAEQLHDAATILHSTRSTEVADFLIKKGISKEITDNQGFTPLMRAIQKQNIPLIEYFLNLGCDFLKKGPYQESALEMLVKYNLLMDKRLIPHLRKLPKNKLTSAQAALYPSNYKENSTAFYNKSFSLERLALIEFLIHEVDCIDNFDDKGNTPLYLAVDRNDTNYIKFLCNNGANPDLKRPPLSKTGSLAGRPPISKYVSCGFSTPQALLDYKQQLVYNRLELIYDGTINSDLAPYILRNREYNAIQVIFNQTRYRRFESCIDKDNLTAEILPIAICLLHYTENTEVVDKLINHGISVDTLYKGRTPLDSALNRSDLTIAKHLLIKGANPHNGLPFHALASYRILTMFYYFLKRNVDINKIDCDGNNALMKICEHMIYFGKDETLIPQKEFLKKIASMGFNISQKNYLGICPLSLIVKYRLLDDEEILDLFKLIPSQLPFISGLLHQTRNERLIHYLIDHNVEVDARNSEGNTALYLAVLRLDYNTVELLTSRGANAKLIQPSFSNDTENDLSPLILLSKKKKELNKQIELAESSMEKWDQLAPLQVKYKICQNIELILTNQI